MTNNTLVILANPILSNLQEIPLLFIQGITYLMPKDQYDTQDVANSRSVRCFPTISHPI